MRITSGPVSDQASNVGAEISAGPFKIDRTAPTLSVPSSAIVAEATTTDGAPVDFRAQTTATDALDPAPILSCTPASGSTFPIGNTSVSCTATDAAGNTSAPRSFTVMVTQRPAVTSPTVTGITATSATLGGTVTAAGTPPLTERGIVYAKTTDSANPILGGAGVTKVVASATGTGVFTVAVSGLTPGTAYTFKAYATSSVGTAYSTTASFTTVPPADLAIALTSTATVTSSTADTNTANDTATATTIIRGGPTR